MYVKYFNLTLVFISIINFQFALLGQENDTKIFKNHRIIKEPNQARRMIEFYDSTGNRVIKTIEVTSLNPFATFDLKNAGLREYYNTPIYELDTTQHIKSHGSIELVSSRYYYKTKYSTPFQLMSSYVISTQGNNYVAILYELSTLNKFGKNISSHTTILVVDSIGNLIKQTPVWDINGSRPVISDDGRFVLFKSGGPYGWEQSGYVPNKLIVYDIRNDKLFIDDKVDIGRPTDLIGGKLFNTAIFYADRSTDIVIYDFYNCVKYVKKISSDEMTKYQDINETGIFFLNSQNIRHLKYSFKNDFVKSTIGFAID